MPNDLNSTHDVVVTLCSRPDNGPIILTCMSQAEGPESQVGGSVGDGAKAVLNSVDRLMHKRLTKVKLRGKERERQESSFRVI